MPSNLSTGSQACTIGTEHTLLDDSSAHTGELVVDLNPMQGGDVVELRVYDKITGTPNVRVVDFASFGPVPPSSDPIQHSIPRMFTRGAKYTIKQTAGTGRTFDWEVRKV